jgi:hypothetical protein
MELETKNLQTLLKSTNRVLKHHNELSKAKGEHYNMFSVFQIETRENKTHSNFLADLLNPKGAHQMGAVFLDLFLKVIKPEIEQGDKKFKDKFPNRSFDTSKVFVKAEYSIGPKNLCEEEGEDEANATGGRIDIFLRDKNGTIICIENKIHAIDQNKQIQRYYNHKTAKNTVFYLTLKGEDPSPESMLKLISGKDFFNISYKEHIIEWLELCLKEVTNFTNLRETINQYILLIKKLTYQLTNQKMKEDLQRLISENYLSSKTIESSIRDVELKATVLFLNEIKTHLETDTEEPFVGDWTISIDEDLNKKWSGLKITHNTWNGVKVKLEGIPNIAWNESDYGIHAPKENYDRNEINTRLAKSEILKDDFDNNHAWPFYKYIFSMEQTHNRARLFDNEKRGELVEEVSLKLKELALECLPLLKGVKKIK